jgi:alkanesulfonate monooxygenase SsuD/methylene tetrahydromethanopterin reductase-like flavin-dependent oxidoreductase (luciferase family)
MKLGLLVEVEEGLTWPRWRGVFDRAEQLGFESVWVSDHLCSPWSSGRAGLEAWTALAVAAAETKRIRMGTLVSPVTFRPPPIVGRMASSLQELSGGRFTLGLGLGWNEAEHAALGIPFPGVAERVGMLRATAQYAKEVPLLIGGMGERSTLPLVAQFADEWNLTTNSADVVRQRSAVLARLCQEMKRDPAEITRSVAVGYLIGRDAAELRERSQRIQRWVAPLAAVVLEHIPETAMSMGWLVGTPEQVSSRMRELAAAGVERVILGHYDLDDMDALELAAQLL